MGRNLFNKGLRSKLALQAWHAIHVVRRAAIEPIKCRILRTQFAGLGQARECSQAPHNRKIIILRIRQQIVFTLATWREHLVVREFCRPTFWPIHPRIDQDSLRAFTANVSEVELGRRERSVGREVAVKKHLTAKVIPKRALALLQPSLPFVFFQGEGHLHKQAGIQRAIGPLILQLKLGLGSRAPTLEPPPGDDALDRVALLQRPGPVEGFGEPTAAELCFLEHFLRGLREGQPIHISDEPLARSRDEFLLCSVPGLVKCGQWVTLQKVGCGFASRQQAPRNRHDARGAVGGALRNLVRRQVGRGRRFAGRNCCNCCAPARRGQRCALHNRCCQRCCDCFVRCCSERHLLDGHGGWCFGSARCGRSLPEGGPGVLERLRAPARWHAEVLARDSDADPTLFRAQTRDLPEVQPLALHLQLFDQCTGRQPHKDDRR
mmetsp:Transcript_95055/g.307656  ORF Transcript_95055/g.307656 Transcript_95055/m.307656 type:complete len:435 (-) Transcript_95055:163-1467(-)